MVEMEEAVAGKSKMAQDTSRRKSARVDDVVIVQDDLVPQT